MNVLHPVFFRPNRVRQPYRGGRILDQFLGLLSEEDGYYSEEWLVSVVRSDHAEQSDNIQEGLTRVVNSDGSEGALLSEVLSQHAEALLGPEYLAAHKNSLKFQAKFVDVNDALPVCSLAHSEAWTVLATRETHDHIPYMMIGWKEDVTAEAVGQAIESGCEEALMNLMHQKELVPGQTYFIPARMPFQISSGVLLLRSQNIGVKDTRIMDHPDAVEITPVSQDDLKRRIEVAERILRRSDEGVLAELVTTDETGSFSLMEAEVAKKMQITIPRPFGLFMCVGGAGRMAWAGGSRELRTGEVFLLPYGIPWIEFHPLGRLNMMILLPPDS